MKTFNFKGDVEDQGAEVETEGDQDPGPGQRGLGGQDQGRDLAGQDQNDHEVDQDPDHVDTEDRGRGLVDDQDLGKGKKSIQV